MIVDAVVANDEIDLAKFRITYLSPLVSKFYIAESAQTFQGRPKPLNFSPQLKDLKKLGAEIEVVVVPQSPDDENFADAWERGRYQRYWFLDYVAQRHPDGVIVFTDIDEVPSLEQLEWASQNLGEKDLACLPMRFVFRRANWLLEPVDQDYRPGVILRGTAFRPNIRGGDFPIAQGELGAHLSYVGFSAEQIKEKFSSFEHTELDVEHLYQDTVLSFSNAWGIDHIGRPGQPGFGLLREAREEDLNSVLKAAIKLYPNWRQDFPRKSLLRRLVASSALSSFRATGRAKTLEDPMAHPLSPRFLRHLASLALHTAIRVTGTGSLIKRILTKRRIQPR